VTTPPTSPNSSDNHDGQAFPVDAAPAIEYASTKSANRWRRLDTEAVRFIIGGVSTTLVSYAVYLLLLPWISYLFAYGIAYGVGIAWSYLVNTILVFRRRPSAMRALAFPLVYVIQYLIGSLLLVILIDHAGVPRSLAPLAVVVLTLPLTYVLSRCVITATPTSPTGKQHPPT
jgi:putative flippase GtrA